MSYSFLRDGVYRDTRTGNLYHRPIIGTRTWRKLTATTITMATKEVAALRTRQLEARLNLAIDPYAELITIGQLSSTWKSAHCPNRKGLPKSGAALEGELGRLNRLLPFWKHRVARDITAEDCRDYHGWRIKQKRSKHLTLARSVDAELTTLSSLFNWAVQNPRKTALRQNPLFGRPRFYSAATTRHCTAVMPMTDEDFHRLAGYLLSSNASRPLGWQLLLEGLTGARTCEILACRIDASQPRQPGYHDNHALHLHRSKKGIEPWALFEAIPGHAPLRDLLIAFRRWHKIRYTVKNSGPINQWFIPGRGRGEPATRCSLTRALARACKELEIPLVTSHGIRAYYVRTLRSLGIDDSEIAKRLGHRSGVGLVERTYGISEPGWFGSRKLDFLPDGFKAAWHRWSPRRSGKVVNLSAYHRHTTTRKTGSTHPNQSDVANHHNRQSPQSKSHILNKSKPG